MVFMRKYRPRRSKINGANGGRSEERAVWLIQRVGLFRARSAGRDAAALRQARRLPLLLRGGGHHELWSPQRGRDRDVNDISGGETLQIDVRIGGLQIVHRDAIKTGNPTGVFGSAHDVGRQGRSQRRW